MDEIRRKKELANEIATIINNLNATDIKGIWMGAQALYAKQEIEKQKNDKKKQ